MSNAVQSPFVKFLEAGLAKGGFKMDDVLAALVPLMKQSLAAHEAGLVAPLEGILETCQKLLKDDAARGELARRGKAAIEGRDIREILRKALTL